MREDIKNIINKSRNVILYSLFFLTLLVVAFIYKNDSKVNQKLEVDEFLPKSSDLKSFKDFLFNQIISPFINVNYQIKNGDTIERILKKYKVQNNDIEKTIVEYKKYGNPTQLAVGNEIDIIVEKSPGKNKNYLKKF